MSINQVKRISYILVMLFVLMPVRSAGETQKEGLDLQGILFGHIQDSYDWHITTINGHPISIPLPVIVKSSTGWHLFLSNRFAHEVDATGSRPGPYNLYISGSGTNINKVCERISGQEV